LYPKLKVMEGQNYYEGQLNNIEVGKTEFAPTFKIFANGNGADTKHLSLNNDSATELVKWLSKNFDVRGVDAYPTLFALSLN